MWELNRLSKQALYPLTHGLSEMRLELLFLLFQPRGNARSCKSSWLVPSTFQLSHHQILARIGNGFSPTKKPKARPETPPWRSATKPRPCPGLRQFWGLFRIFRIRQTCPARSWWRSTGRPPRPCHWWPPVRKTSYRQPSKESTSSLPQQAG